MVSNKLSKKFQELSNIKYKAITVGKCVKCGTCIQYCPLNLRIFGKKGKAVTIDSNRSCGGCSVCFHRCPQQAIELIPLGKND
ncbi:MAG: hypothetical protein BAJALOKI2v1_140056 [Promethearchaeota archaeon]|nr:MAG: hypothetical protein BAJALOKI2v1_140056 [Candidatus Lokiarchaeota archaeon]